MIKCKHCDKSVKRKGKIFCSRECSSQFMAQKILAKRKVLICKLCGKKYTTKPANQDKSLFCSRICKDKSLSLNPHKKKTGKDKICKACDKIFYVPKCLNRISYCSQKCYSNGNRIQKKCQYCSKEYIIQKHKKGSNFCSRECYADFLKTMTGDKSPNWQGGITSENENARKISRYSEWRNTIYRRDNYVCQKCNESGKRLHAHHIKPFSEYKELRYDIPNGITLCIKCHREVHMSRTCSVCGYIAKSNRKSQSLFACGKCGFTANADFNASTNIALRGRVNGPIVTSALVGTQSVFN